MRDKNVFEIKIEIFQEYVKIKYLSYKEEFQLDDFFYYPILFIYLTLNNYFNLGCYDPLYIELMLVDYYLRLLARNNNKSLLWLVR